SLQGANPYGKPVSGGEGGLACTNDRTLYQRMLAYSQFNRSNLQKELEGSPFEKLGKTVLGLKFRPHPMAMGLALISLQSLDERNRKIAAHIAKLRVLLKRCDLFTFPEMPQHAAMGGIFGGLHLIADHPDVEKLVSLLQAEGMPILGPMVGHLEYKGPLLSEGFDLWGQGRGPLDKSWEGLAPYVAPKPGDFPVAEALKSRVVQVPAFIDIDPEYFICFERALEKVYAHLRK
ncbi:MAG: DegT/DnrJ/EryC1/StrS family aminotransferase, partial [Chlamydiia bacterium]|nr:DegT/DnrJ/EryC1/StrS family aminotransferase [Chlamydiia bacterium]